MGTRLSINRKRRIVGRLKDQVFYSLFLKCLVVLQLSQLHIDGNSTTGTLPSWLNNLTQTNAITPVLSICNVASQAMFLLASLDALCNVGHCQCVSQSLTISHAVHIATVKFFELEAPSVTCCVPK